MQRLENAGFINNKLKCLNMVNDKRDKFQVFVGIITHLFPYIKFEVISSKNNGNIDTCKIQSDSKGGTVCIIKTGDDNIRDSSGKFLFRLPIKDKSDILEIARYISDYCGDILNNLTINKGDSYICIKNFVMCDGEIAYSGGELYDSEEIGCITDNSGIIGHIMNTIEDFSKYFVKINRLYYEGMELPYLNVDGIVLNKRVGAVTEVCKCLEMTDSGSFTPGKYYRLCENVIRDDKNIPYIFDYIKRSFYTDSTMDFPEINHALKLDDKKEDCVNHPAHYTHGGIECIDAMTSAFGNKVVMDFCLGNAFKYVFRCQSKDSDIIDLEKAKWYIDKYIELNGKTQNKTDK